MADSSRHELWYIEESTYGTTPATPAWIHLRINGHTLKKGLNTSVSNLIRSDRQIGNFRSSTATVAGDITSLLTYGEHDDIIEAALQGTWATDTPIVGTDQLKVGTTRRSFSILSIQQDLDAGAKKYELFTGVEISGMSLSFTPEGDVGITYNCMGQDASLSTTEPAGSTYGSISTADPFNSVNATVNEGGSSIGVVTEFSPTLDNGLSSQYVIGSPLTLQPSNGNSDAQGSMTIVFNDTTVKDKFLAETASSFDILLTDPAGNTFKYSNPEIKYTDADAPVSSEGSRLLTMPYQALLDATDATNILIERNPI